MKDTALMATAYENQKFTPIKKQVETLYLKYHKKVYQKCLRMTRSEEDAGDLSQEVWIKILAKLPTFQHKSHPTTWLYSITHNHCIDFLRKRTQEVKFMRGYSKFNYGFEYTDWQSDEIELKQLFEKLESQIEHFRGHEKLNILWQKYSEGKTINELSDCMNISESAVKMRLQRAKKTLRQKVTLKMKEG